MYVVEQRSKGKGNTPGPWVQWRLPAGAASWSTRELAKNVAWMNFGRSNPSVRVRYVPEEEA